MFRPSQIPYSAPHQGRVANDQREVAVTRRYETIYIFDAALEEPAVTEKLTRFHALLTKDGKGTVSDVNHWGKRTLTYRLKKKDTGYYVVAKFEAPRDLLPEYERAVRLDEGVLRYLVTQAGMEPVKPVAAPVAPREEDDTEEDDA